MPVLNEEGDFFARRRSGCAGGEGNRAPLRREESGGGLAAPLEKVTKENNWETRDELKKGDSI